mmetsp:Transcript_35036/g.84573  ORF Transcript_35036/g.84573 Transcript_35036/m.84573 type:complete len:99 (-) Transcript_35036:1269-1565(-)
MPRVVQNLVQNHSFMYGAPEGSEPAQQRTLVSFSFLSSDISASSSLAQRILSTVLSMSSSEIKNAYSTWFNADLMSIIVPDTSSNIRGKKGQCASSSS